MSRTAPPPGNRARLRGLRGLLLAGALALGTSCATVATPGAAGGAPSCRVAAVGDSLTVGASAALPAALERQGCTLAWVDARVSRPTSEGVDVIARRAAAGQLPSVLIVGLGTNDRYRMADFPGHVDTVMRLAAGREVIWIDLAYGPVRSQLNAVLADRARRYENLSIMGWNHEYWSNPSWRASDGVHATPAGYAARADLMARHARAVTE